MNHLLTDQHFDVRAFVEVDKATLSIAAILYDVANGKEIASFSHPVDETNFPDALGKLKEFCGSYPIWAFDKDQVILERNCAYFSIPFPFRAPFIRVKSLLRSWNLNPRDYSAGTLYKAAGLKMGDAAYDGLHNVRSMATAVSYFENRVI